MNAADQAAFRPRVLVLVVGTGTEIGKTWTCAALARALRTRGCSVSARKPAQSFEPAEREAGATDAQVLGRAVGEPADRVCPPHRWYGVALAPPMAADALGRPAFTIGELAGELVWPEGTEVGLVETAGGVRSPMAADGDAVALAAALDPDLVLLVADAGLGTINAVRLSTAALGDRSTAVHLNRFDPDDDLHRRNLAWLAERDGFSITTTIDELAARVAALSPSRRR